MARNDYFISQIDPVYDDNNDISHLLGHVATTVSSWQPGPAPNYEPLVELHDPVGNLIGYLVDSDAQAVLNELNRG